MILSDKSGLVRDFCIPSMGSENHAQGHVFMNGVSERVGSLQKDFRFDASLCGLFPFGVFSASDGKIVNTIKALKEKLWRQTEIGGLARYEFDRYQSVTVPTSPGTLESSVHYGMHI